MRTYKLGLPFILAVCCLLTLPPLQTACHKVTLAPGGAYTDPVLYESDLAITTSKSVLDNVLSWEKANRAALWKLSPDIKHGCDHIRRNASLWFDTAFAARDTYVANPTTDNASKLKLALAELATAVAQASQYYNLAVQPKDPNPK